MNERKRINNQNKNIFTLNLHCNDVLRDEDENCILKKYIKKIKLVIMKLNWIIFIEKKQTIVI